MTERAIIRALSLFSGAGGLDMGARIADVRVPLATDSDESALAVHNAALGTRTLVGDITRLLEGELQRAWGSVAPDIVLGGPPCTAFSHAGFWIEGKREGRDPAALVLRAYLRAVETFKPAAFLMENVPGLTFKTHRATFEATLKAARRLGYTTSWTILNARNFGVPQARRRLFLAGIRGSSAVSLDDWPNFPERTPAWAFADLTTEPEDGERPVGRHGSLLSEVPPGKNYLHFTEEHGAPEPRFRYRGRYWSFLYKLSPDVPAPTVPAQRITYNGPFHWDSRHLRIRELARLQMLPDWLLLDASSASRRFIGNAVPPILGAAVLERVVSHLEGRRPEYERHAALAAAWDPKLTCREVLDAYPPPLLPRMPLSRSALAG